MLANVPPGLEEPLRTNAQRVLEELILKFGRLQGNVIESAANKPVQNSGLTLLVFNNGASPKEYADSVRQFFAETLVDLGEDELIEDMIDQGVRDLEAEGELIEDVDPGDLKDEDRLQPDDRVAANVIALIEENCLSVLCESPQVALESRLVDDLGFDSIDVTEFVILLEGDYNISIPDVEANKFRTVGDVVRYIKDNTL